MNSINQNQPETNRADLRGQPAVAKLKEIVGIAKTCFFCTKLSESKGISARPMSVLEVDDAGNLWFLSASDNRHNIDLAEDPFVVLYLQGSPHSDFLRLSGKGTVSHDKTRIKELWKPLYKTWFTEGIEDPRITVIKITPSEGFYWDTKHGNTIAGIKMFIGAAIGQTLDDSIEGKLTF